MRGICDNPNSLNNIMSKELCNVSIDIGTEYMELALDSVLTDELTKEIPIVKTIAAMGRMGIAIRENIFAKKVLIFLQEFHKGNYGSGFEEFKVKMRIDNQYRDRVSSHIMAMLDRLISEKKSQILAKLLIAHINEKINWNTFVDLSSCLELLFIVDFEVLAFLYNFGGCTKLDAIQIGQLDNFIVFGAIQRLKNYGFISTVEATWENIGNDLEKEIEISGWGKVFYDLCLK